jgi:flagellar assembly factor FliW
MVGHVDTGEGTEALGVSGLADSPIVHFTVGIPGFPHSHDFVVVALGPQLEPFAKLRCVDTPGLEFVVAPPGLLFPDFTVEIDEESVSTLGLRSADDAIVLVIVTLAKAPAVPSANLLGPLVVNRSTLSALQVVQHGSGYGVAVPLQAGTARP